MEKKLRLAMVGAGSRANQVIYPAFQDLEDVEFVGICDIDAQRLQETGDKYHIENRYGQQGIYGYRRMVEEQKLNLYVEKPLALNIHQARSLAELARRGG